MLSKISAKKPSANILHLDVSLAPAGRERQCLHEDLTAPVIYVVKQGGRPHAVHLDDVALIKDEVEHLARGMGSVSDIHCPIPLVVSVNRCPPVRNGPLPGIANSGILLSV